MFFFGKKRIGIRAKYAASNPNFSGRFTGWSPHDRDDYDNLKKKALARKRKTRIQQKFKKQRDSAIYLVKKTSDWSNQRISEELSVASGIKVSPRTIDYAIQNITGQKDDQINN